MIDVKILADSVSPEGHRLTTFYAELPRFVWPQVLTHRVFSRSAQSSRAMRTDEMIDAVRQNGVKPLKWRYAQKGMQPGRRMDPVDRRRARSIWVLAMESAVKHAVALEEIGTVKDKSTYARKFVSVFNTVIEPGWRGWLTVEVVNHGAERVQIPAGAPICQVVFERTDRACTPYAGKYQDQIDAPQEAILNGVD